MIRQFIFAILLLCCLADAQNQTLPGRTTQGDILPASTGQNVGNSRQLNLFAQNIPAPMGKGIASSDQYSGATASARIAAAAKSFGTSQGMVFVPSTETAGSSPASIPDNVTLIDFRGRDSGTFGAAVRIGDTTAFGNGPRNLLAIRHFNRPSLDVSAFSAVTSVGGTATSPPSDPQTAIEAVLETDGTGFDNKTNHAGEFHVQENVMGFGAGAHKINRVMGYLAGPGAPSASARGTIDHWWNFYSQSLNNLTASTIAVSDAVGFYAEYPTFATTNMPFYANGPNSEFNGDGVNSVTPNALPVVQIQGNSSARSGPWLKILDTNGGAMVFNFDPSTKNMLVGAAGAGVQNIKGDLLLKSSATNGSVQLTPSGKGLTVANGKGMQINGGITDGSGYKHERGVSGCATAASAGATCTTTIAWGTAFPDTHYTAVCTGAGATSGIPMSGGIGARSAASVTFITVAATAAAAQYSGIDCVAVHD